MTNFQVEVGWVPLCYSPACKNAPFAKLSIQILWDCLRFEILASNSCYKSLRPFEWVFDDQSNLKLGGLVYVLAKHVKNYLLLSHLSKSKTLSQIQDLSLTELPWKFQALLGGFRWFIYKLKFGGFLYVTAQNVKILLFLQFIWIYFLRPTQVDISALSWF